MQYDRPMYPWSYRPGGNGSHTLGDIPTSYSDAVSQWQAAVASFNSAYTEFLNYKDAAANDPQLASAWNDLASRANFAQIGIRDIASRLGAATTAVSNAVDTGGELVANAIESVFGLPSLKGLGIAPLVVGVAIATIIGSTAYLASVAADLIKFNRVMSAARDSSANADQTTALLRAAGLPGSGGIFGGFSKNLALGVLGIGAAIYFLPKLLKVKS